jgi:hypothetical protein
VEDGGGADQPVAADVRDEEERIVHVPLARFLIGKGRKRNDGEVAWES